MFSFFGAYNDILTNILYFNKLFKCIVYINLNHATNMVTNTLDIHDMRASAGRACELMKVLANPDRLMICCQLSQHEMCVSDLEEQLSIVQPTLSQQLTVLRNAGLVKTRREGKNIFYQLTSTPAVAVMNTLFQQFCKSQTTRSRR